MHAPRALRRRGLASRRKAAGVGKLIRIIVRKMTPILKEVGKVGKKVITSRTAHDLLNEATIAVLDAGVRVADNALAGENVIKSAKENVGEIGKRMLSKTSSVLDEKIKQIKKQNIKVSQKKPRKNTSKKYNTHDENSSKVEADIAHIPNISSNNDNNMTMRKPKRPHKDIFDQGEILSPKRKKIKLESR